jgi:hypothetical protein
VKCACSDDGGGDDDNYFCVFIKKLTTKKYLYFDASGDFDRGGSFNFPSNDALRTKLASL